MALSPRVRIPYPSENADPYYDSFESMVLALDASIYATREDRNTILSSEATFTFNASTNVLTWDAQINILSPITGYSWRLAAGSVILLSNQIFYITVTRNPQNDQDYTAQVASAVPGDVRGDDQLLVGIRVNNRVYFRNGASIADGDSKPLFTSATAITSGDGVRVTNAGSIYTIHGVRGTCSLEQFGAKGDGTTDDSAALTSAVAALTAGTYSALILGAKKYFVPGTYQLPANCSIIGQGIVSTLKTTSNAAFLKPNDGVAIDNLTLEGSGATGTANNQDLIKDGTSGSAGSGHGKWRVTNVRLLNAGGRGIYHAEGPTSAGSTPYQGPQLLGCRAIACAYGYYFDQRGEYASVIGCHAQECTVYGAHDQAGNTSFSECYFTDNYADLEITADTNDSHSHAVGCKFNHATFGPAISYSGQNGFTAVGCEIYNSHGNAINVGAAATSALVISNCRIDIGAPTVPSGQSITFIDCEWPNGAGGPVLSDAYVDPGARIEFFGVHHNANINRGIPTAIQAILTQTFTFPANADQTATAKLSSAREIILATGSLTSNGKTFRINYTPDAGRQRFVRNNTPYSITVAWATGTGITLLPGNACVLGADGTNARDLAGQVTGISSDGTTLTIATPKTSNTGDATGKLSFQTIPVSITTANATPTTLQTFAVGTTTGVAIIRSIVSAFDSTGASVGVWSVDLAYVNVGGTLTQVGTGGISPYGTPSGTLALAASVAAGGNITLTATGIAATNLRWTSNGFQNVSVF